MKYTLAIAAVLVAATCGTTMADEGHVSKSQLAELGLPGMSVMSDAQGKDIRGQGFVFASSRSNIDIPLFDIDVDNEVVSVGRREAGARSGVSGGVVILGAAGGSGGGGGFFQIRVNARASGYAYGFAR